ncbi:MAG: ATP-binding protein [Bacteroidetes bacterium]|nr:ATP-binding protein [Bacteroidota bacterium]
MEKENKKLIRVALIGPESTAKSTLSEQLAKHYNTVWVKEYAREYLSEINRKYTLDDIVEIAKQQLQENPLK